MGWYSDDYDVPFNLKGITKKDELKRAEYNATSLRAIELSKTPILGSYDLEHLQKIHHHLFQDIYGWAGKIRTKNFYKKDSFGWCSDFADVAAITDIADEVSQFINDRNNLKGLDKEAFTDAFTHISVRLNEMHPFPEGNGRSIRILLRQLAHEAGYNLKTEKCTGKEWNVASARSMTQTRNGVDAYNNPRPEVRQGDSTLIRELLARSISPIHEKILKTSTEPIKSEKFRERLAALPVIEADIPPPPGGNGGGRDKNRPDADQAAARKVSPAAPVSAAARMFGNSSGFSRMAAAANAASGTTDKAPPVQQKQGALSGTLVEHSRNIPQEFLQQEQAREEQEKLQNQDETPKIE